MKNNIIFFFVLVFVIVICTSCINKNEDYFGMTDLINNLDETNVDKETEAEQTAFMEVPYMENETDDTFAIMTGGKKISDGKKKLFQENLIYVMLPFVETMSGLGAKIEWENEKIAKISLGENTYILDIQEVILTEEGDDFNCILPPPGGTLYFESGEKELFLDHITFRNVFGLLGLEYNVSWDYQNNTVNID